MGNSGDQTISGFVILHSFANCRWHHDDEWQLLNIVCADHCMIWAACTLGYFGSLCSAEFTVPSLASFSTSLHLTLQDIAVDGVLAPSCMCIMIKVSKTDPFCRRGDSFWSGYPSSLCSSIHDGISCVEGQCPRPFVYASRCLPAVSGTSHRLAETYCLWQAFKRISQALAFS